MDETNTNMIYPVVLKVPEEHQVFKGRESVVFLRQHARKAVVKSAQQYRMDMPDLENDDKGAPIPKNGFYWSLSHKPGYVAGVVANMPIGIDIEKIKPVRPLLFDKVMDENERKLMETISYELFYRVWTAKETVLKAVGVGLKGLSHCKIIDIINKTFLKVSYHQTQWVIEHTCYDNHLIAVVKNDKDIRWVLPVSDD